MEWLSAPEYWPAQLLFQRGLGVVYLIAFTVALNQFPALLGEHGLLPVPRFLSVVTFREAPSIFHWRYSDLLLRTVAGTGVVIAGLVVAGIVERAPLAVSMLCWFVLWALYQSIVNVGQVFYGFGWESMLLEAGFLAIFLGNARAAPSILLIFLIRWVLFRLEFGAGLIKMRGDSCWRKLTCLEYHHETQPMPNPLSWFFHNLPGPIHRVEVAANHFAQLVVPFGLFFPQPVASIAGAIIIATQLWLVLSGNFSWLNALTIVLAFAAFDASAIDVVFIPGAEGVAASPLWHDASVMGVTALVLLLSWRPARNLLSPNQLMNFSFDRLHLVNTYGAFGSITRARDEIVIEGTDDAVLTPQTEWREYEFKGKPGDVRRLPRQFAPYHLRLDWLMWFAALSPSYAVRWFDPLLQKLLEGDEKTLKLLRHNPFADRPPRFVRARLYRYRFTTPRERRATRTWWSRELLRDFVPPVTLQRGGHPTRRS